MLDLGLSQHGEVVPRNPNQFEGFLGELAPAQGWILTRGDRPIAGGNQGDAIGINRGLIVENRLTICLKNG